MHFPTLLVLSIILISNASVYMVAYNGNSNPSNCTTANAIAEMPQGCYLQYPAYGIYAQISCSSGQITLLSGCGTSTCNDPGCHTQYITPGQCNYNSAYTCQPVAIQPTITYQTCGGVSNVGFVYNATNGCVGQSQYVCNQTAVVVRTWNGAQCGPGSPTFENVIPMGVCGSTGYGNSIKPLACVSATNNANPIAHLSLLILIVGFLQLFQ